MTNPLTGDFDAVVQVSVPTVNRLLATMHQNHGNDADLPTLPHRAVAIIGDKPLGGSLAGISGRTDVQIGVPTVALVADAPRSATVSCWIRARYQPEPKTASLPEFIHGKIVARFDVTPVKYKWHKGIHAAASPIDAYITFTDPKLNPADSEKVTALIRDVLRTQGTAVLPLPPPIPSAVLDLQALTDSQGRQALALPVTLEGAAPASGNLGQIFLDGGAFAIAVSKEFILKLIQPAIKALNEAKPSFPVPGGPFTAHYTVSMTAKASWNGALTLSISGTAKTSHWLFPNVGFTVSQSFALVLDASTQSISITPSGQPNVTITVGFPHNYVGPAESKATNAVTNTFVAERDKALVAASEKINAGLATQREQVHKLLRKIDDMAEVMIASLQPSSDGVVLRGGISLSPRRQPRVEFSQLGDGSGYTAFDSWVPGGWITQFVWTFWRFEDLKDHVPGGAELVLPYQERKFDDRYVLQEKNLPGIKPPAPPGGGPSIEPAGNLVLALEALESLVLNDPPGVWIPPDGQLCLWLGYEYVDPATGAMFAEKPNVKVVKPLNPGVKCTLPAWWPELHVKPSEFGPCPEMNVIVDQLIDSELVGGIELLLQAVRQAERPDAPIMLIFALPIGSRGPSRALGARARELRQRSPQLGVALADRDAYWLRALDLSTAEARPALRLVDPAGRLAWRHDGAADASTIAAALREHLVAGQPPRAGFLQARVRPGHRAPDFTFEVVRGDRIALRHLRGDRLAVLFVSEGHAALDAALGHLAARAGKTDEPPLAVIVVVGGEPGGTTPHLRDPSFDWIVVADPEGAIARSYGITIRPTAVLVDWDGRVSTVQVMSSAISASRPAVVGAGDG